MHDELANNVGVGRVLPLMSACIVACQSVGDLLWTAEIRVYNTLWLYEAHTYLLCKASRKHGLFLLDLVCVPVYCTALQQGIKTMEALKAFIHADVNTYYPMTSALSKEHTPGDQWNVVPYEAVSAFCTTTTSR